jgi:hypothetical protein
MKAELDYTNACIREQVLTVSLPEIAERFTAITNDTVDLVYATFSEVKRIPESERLLRSIPARSLCIDNLIKARRKARVVTSSGTREQLLGGGVIYATNELDLVTAWVCCLIDHMELCTDIWLI